ncbi:hypothetical protein C7451_106153 [Blastomonas natatoria]|uniref:Tail protein n=1 Tax=Blastomonas natatoria TaxID=34015 RepID=A0A2V3VH84_9SPHN|nr:hypothetical protein [Blastomonas natatoria]PXW75989.1 hypothetical protein C7451_106153 [Blastomonas natatoria]
MAKVLKVAALAVGAAAVIVATGGAGIGFLGAAAAGLATAGLSAGLLIAASTALSIGASLIAKKPQAPRNSPEAINRLNASIDPRTPRKIVFGQTAMATDIRDQEYTDNQTYLHRFIVTASHAVQSIDEIWFDEKLAWTSGGGAQGEFAGYLDVATRTEGSAVNAINISARMGSTRRYTGLAYVHLRFKLTGNTKRTDSPFAQSIPSRITIRGKGAKVYDPRLDSTVPGGSGSQRADDQSTWAWDDDAARNPALQLLWYLLGWRINDKLAVGLGIPQERIDLESFIAAANLCDDEISLAAGGTEPRYRSDGVFSEADSPPTVIDALKASMYADFDDVGGKLRLFVFYNDLAVPQASFDTGNVLGEFEWRQTPALDETFNIVRGIFTDPSDNALYQPVDYPQIELDSVDGIDRIDTFDLPMVQSASQAQRLAKQRLQRQQFGGAFTCTFDATGWRIRKNSPIELSFAPLGWVDKLFRVAEMEHRVDGTVPVVLREESPLIYAWDEEEQPPVQAAPPSTYDFGKNPIVQGIDENAAAGALANSYTAGLAGNITQADAGSDVTVTIPTHTRVYTGAFPQRSVTGGTITGLDYETDYLIYYDDPELDGGAVTYQTTTIAADAYFSSDHPWRHFVARVTTVAAGGTGGSTGGSGPPGSGGWDGDPGTQIP